MLTTPMTVLMMILRKVLTMLILMMILSGGRDVLVFVQGFSTVFQVFPRSSQVVTVFVFAFPPTPRDNVIECGIEAKPSTV